MSGADRIRASFAAAAADGRAALIVYILSGYPSRAGALAAAEAALSAGADMLEIGVPFSDPMADGPTIAEAGRVSLAAGGGLPSALGLVADLRARGHEQPLMVMTYLNPLVSGGQPATLRALRDAGADGLIVPDLPAGADRRLERLAAACGLACSFLVAPNTPIERIEAAVAASTGFVYVVPLFGVTGARESLADGARNLIASVRDRAAGRVPVAAGFGLHTAAQVAELASVADGLIVGSALVAALRDGGADRLEALVRTLASGTQRA
jgi:tryptophan synthase alpha chain